MTNSTVKNGTIVLPKELRPFWKGAKVSIRPFKDKLVIERLTPKIKEEVEAWKKLAGILKKKKIPNPVKWQRKIRLEWEP